jgi:hypothetical protein
MESMRAVGYSVEAAISDIIDNSLSATASQIHVKYDASGNPFVAILDNGRGMSPTELTDAMRHGSSNPTDARAKNDLGRFGLGLKTASLSQCRRLTVISKKEGTVSARRWDLDLVHDTGRWLVAVPAQNDLAALPLYSRLIGQPTGTLVVWEDLDRLTAGASDPQREMTTKMAPLLEHLALVFHRFTQNEDDIPAVAITVNGLPLPARDPFLGENTHRQHLEGQVISHERGRVVVTPYVLPPVSHLSSDEIEIAGGREGLRGTQGFYVYRSRRLVIWGTWFRLVPKEEFYKLTRVRVDIPNSFDDLWDLDIKKSAAYPPDPIRTRLKDLIPHFADTSKKAITYKGRNVSPKGYVPLWNRFEPKPRTFRYEPNPEHPLIESLAKSLGEAERHSLQVILEALGASLPYEGIYGDMCRDSRETGDVPDKSELMQLASDLLRITSLDIDRILQMDPLCLYPELHEEIRKEMEK